MIALDTSVLISIILAESDADEVMSSMIDAGTLCLSAVSALEAGIVARTRAGAKADTRLRQLFADLAVEIVPFDRAQADVALERFRIYGKGIHPKARLNFGDCASYALAKSRNIPLLFKGDDFTHTDVLTIASRQAP
jgi:ribonuclease VapC